MTRWKTKKKTSSHTCACDDVNLIFLLLWHVVYSPESQPFHFPITNPSEPNLAISHNRSSLSIALSLSTLWPSLPSPPISLHLQHINSSDQKTFLHPSHVASLTSPKFYFTHASKSFIHQITLATFFFYTTLTTDLRFLKIRKRNPSLWSSTTTK